MRKTMIVCDGCGKEESMNVPTETKWRSVEAKSPNGTHEADACSSACEPIAFKTACAVRDRAVAHDAAHHAFMEALTKANQEHAASPGSDADKLRSEKIRQAHLIENEAKKVADVEFKKTVGRDP